MLARSLRLCFLGLTLVCMPALALAQSAATPGAQAAPRQKPTGDARIPIWRKDLFNDPGSAVLGNPNGDVTIVEFFDYNCPFSRAVEPRVQALLKSDPNVRMILKEFPIEPQVTSPIAARAALAAIKQGKYEPFHQAMMVVTGHALTTDEIFDIAQKSGLDVDRLRADMESPEFYSQIISNFNLARGLRIFETPTFIIGDHIVTEASKDIDFPKMVAAERAK